jgi:hypothetical protein
MRQWRSDEVWIKTGLTVLTANHPRAIAWEARVAGNEVDKPFAQLIDSYSGLAIHFMGGMNQRIQQVQGLPALTVVDLPWSRIEINSSRSR